MYIIAEMRHFPGAGHEFLGCFPSPMLLKKGVILHFDAMIAYTYEL